MPAAYVKDIAKKTGRPLASVEKDWARAKEVVLNRIGRSEKRSRTWGLITHVFQRIVGKKQREKNEAAEPTDGEIDEWLQEGVVSMSRGAYFDGGSTQTLPGEQIPNFLWMRMTTPQLVGYPEQDDGHSPVGKPAPGEGAASRQKSADQLTAQAAKHRALADKDPGKKWVHLKRATELEGIAANMTRDDAGSHVGETALPQPQTIPAQDYPKPGSASPRRLEIEKYTAHHNPAAVAMALARVFSDSARRPDIASGKQLDAPPVHHALDAAASLLAQIRAPSPDCIDAAERELPALGRPLDVLSGLIAKLSKGPGNEAALSFLHNAHDVLVKRPIGEGEIDEVGRSASRASIGGNPPAAAAPKAPAPPKAPGPAAARPRPSLPTMGKYPTFRSSTAMREAAEIPVTLIENVLRHAEPEQKGGLERVVRFSFERALAEPVTKFSIAVERTGASAACQVECCTAGYPGDARAAVQAVLERALRGRFNTVVRQRPDGRWQVYVSGNRSQDRIFRDK